jgi:hypothetical protein
MMKKVAMALAMSTAKQPTIAWQGVRTEITAHFGERL